MNRSDVLPGRKRVLLAGCGHAHLEVLRRGAAFRKRGVELIVVDPGRFWYSGRGSGLFGGRFTPDEASLDPAAIAEANGAGHRRDAVAGLDRSRREAILASGERIAYDLVSFNVGSEVERPESFGDATAVKPIGALPALARSLAGAARPLDVLVVGGGASAAEIAGNLLHLRTTSAPDLRVTIASDAARLLPAAPRGASRRAAESLRRRGARLRFDAPIEAIGDGAAHLVSGERIACDLAILATGLRPNRLMGRLGLSVRGGGLRVGTDLAAIGDRDVFAAGDCSAIDGFPLTALGVHGVKAGPILAYNLLARIENRPMRAFRPQRRALTILDLADGEGIAIRGRFWLAGPLMLAWKMRLDEGFLDRHRPRAATQPPSF